MRKRLRKRRVRRHRFEASLLPKPFDFGMGDGAGADVEALGEAGVFFGGFVPAFVGDGEGVGGGGVAEGEGAGAADGSGHVGDAVVDDAVDDVGGVFVGGGAGGFEAAALVDGDVDDDAAVLHHFEVFAGDEARGAGAGDEDSADDEVGFLEGVADGEGVGVDGGDIGGHDVVEVAEAVEVNVEEGDVGPEAGGDFGGVVADDASAQDDDIGGGDAGDAAEEDAAAHHRFFEVFGAFLDAHFSRDFGHRGEAGEATEFVGDGFVGDGGDAGLQAGFDEFTIGGEVEVSEDDLAGLHVGPFGGEGFFDFDYHFSAGPEFGGGGDDFSAGMEIFLIRDAAADASLGFDEDSVAVAGEDFDAAGDHADAVFVGFHFFGDADDHGVLLERVGIQRSIELVPNSARVIGNR